MSRLFDVNTQKSIALPAAAATANTASIDLGAVNVGPVAAGLVEVRLGTDAATPALVDAKTITLRLEDSADNITFVSVPTVGNMVITGAGGVGAAAKQFRFYLPPDTRRYIRGSADVLAAGGSNIAVTFTLALAI